MAPLVAQGRLNISTIVLAAGHFNSSLLYCVWRIPFQHHTMRAQAPTFACPLAPNTLTWAAFLLPLSGFGFATRNDVSRLCPRGAMAPRCFTIKLLCAAMASHTPWSARTHHPPFAPVSPRLLLCGSLSHSLPLSLSCPLSCPLSRSPSLRSFSIAPHSLSLLSVPLPLRPTLSLSLSLSHKRGFFFGLRGEGGRGSRGGSPPPCRNEN